MPQSPQFSLGKTGRKQSLSVPCCALRQRCTAFYTVSVVRHTASFNSGMVVGYMIIMNLLLLGIVLVLTGGWMNVSYWCVAGTCWLNLIFVFTNFHSGRGRGNKTFNLPVFLLDSISPPHTPHSHTPSYSLFLLGFSLITSLGVCLCSIFLFVCFSSQIPTQSTIT